MQRSFWPRLALAGLLIVTLFLPVATPVSAAPSTDSHYVVKAGDTLFGIALRNGVALNALAAANGIQNVNLIYVGQVLTIPGGASASASSSGAASSPSPGSGAAAGSGAPAGSSSTATDSTVRDLFVTTATAPVHSSPSTASGFVKTKFRGDPIHTLGRLSGQAYQGSSEWYRVALAGGGSAYMPAATLGTSAGSPSAGVARAVDSTVRNLRVSAASAPVHTDATTASALVKMKFSNDPIRTLGRATGQAYQGSSEWYKVALGGGGSAYMPAVTLGQASAVSAAAAPAPTPAPTPAPAAAATNPIVGSTGFDYGIQVHMIHQDHGPIISHLKTLGVRWVKQQIPWAGFEPSRGNIQWGEIDRLVNSLNANGFRVLLSVPTAPVWARPGGTDLSVAGPPADFNEYGRFMGQLAARYKGKVQMYEIWNEQNLWYEWGGTGGKLNAGQYVQLLKVAYQGIKAADPGAIVVSGAPTPTGFNDGNIAIDDALYLEQMYQAGLKSWSDAIGVHPSGYLSSPLAHCSGGQFANHRSFCFRNTMETYRNIMVKYGDGGKKLVPTEFGWAASENVGPPNAGYEYAASNSEAEQAQFIRQAYEQARAWGWVGPTFLWNLNFAPVAGAGDEKAKFGIVRADWSSRPAYWELANLTP